jgi:hypothetical protein
LVYFKNVIVPKIALPEYLDCFEFLSKLGTYDALSNLHDCEIAADVTLPLKSDNVSKMKIAAIYGSKKYITALSKITVG